MFSTACGESENQSPKLENRSPGDLVAATRTQSRGRRK
jgi:hypothetical protein